MIKISFFIKSFLGLCISLLFIFLFTSFGNSEKKTQVDTNLSRIPDITPLEPQKDPIGETVSRLLDEMSLEEKISQSLMVSVSGNTEISPYSVKAFKYTPGAIILYKFNFASHAETVNKFIASCNTSIAQKTSAMSSRFIPPFFATDNEGGTVFRTSAVTSPLPAANVLSQKGDAKTAKALYEAQAIQMKSLGLSMNLGPVSEVGDAKTAVLGTRLFSHKPSQVSSLAYECVSAMQENGIACVLKHFPGSGNTDTHKATSTIELDYKSFKESCEVFRKPLSSALVVMASHVIVNCLDNLPFCLSKKGLDFLRDEFNFSGVIMSDDIIMKALAPYGDNYTDLACQAILAGCDLILYSASDFTALIEGIAKRALAEPTLQARIHEACANVLYAKIKIGLLDKNGEATPPKPFQQASFSQAYQNGMRVYEIYK